MTNREVIKHRGQQVDRTPKIDFSGYGNTAKEFVETIDKIDFKSLNSLADIVGENADWVVYVRNLLGELLKKNSSKDESGIELVNSVYKILCRMPGNDSSIFQINPNAVDTSKGPWIQQDRGFYARDPVIRQQTLLSSASNSPIKVSELGVTMFAYPFNGLKDTLIPSTFRVLSVSFAGDRYSQGRETEYVKKFLGIFKNTIETGLMNDIVHKNESSAVKKMRRGFLDIKNLRREYIKKVEEEFKSRNKNISKESLDLTINTVRLLAMFADMGMLCALWEAAGGTELALVWRENTIWNVVSNGGTKTFSREPKSRWVPWGEGQKAKSSWDRPYDENGYYPREDI